MDVTLGFMVWGLLAFRELRNLESQSLMPLQYGTGLCWHPWWQLLWRQILPSSRPCCTILSKSVQFPCCQGAPLQPPGSILTNPASGCCSTDVLSVDWRSVCSTFCPADPVPPVSFFISSLVPWPEVSHAVSTPYASGTVMHLCNIYY